MDGDRPLCSEVDSLRFELCMNQCNDKLSRLAHEILEEASRENQHEHWNQSVSRSQSKHHNQQASSLPTQLPARAYLPSCAVFHLENGESLHPRLDIPGRDYKQLNHEDGEISSSTSGIRSSPRSSADSNASSSVPLPNSHSFNSSQLHAQRKLFAESQIGRTSFQKLLEPKLP